MDLEKDLPLLQSPGNAFGLMLEQLRICCAQHTQCNLPRLEAGVERRGPLRLLQLDVGQSTVRLVSLQQGGHVSYSAKYAALSYCWGGDQQLKLTKQTEEEMSLGLSTSQLPQLHRDAIWTCAQLGLSYLWIDALCIRQDDERDWAEHASRLATIYSAAHVTIQALACSSTMQSMFTAHTQATFQTGGHQPAQGQNYRSRKAEIDYVKVGHHQDRFYGRQDPLVKRGWAFQESAFSRRVISFTSHELQWRCRETYSCECGKPPNSDFDKPMLYEGMAPMDKEGVYTLWYQHIQRYSCTELTQPSDYLAAISSLASRVAAYTGDTYIAGVWLCDLARSLIWITEPISYTALISPGAASRKTWAGLYRGAASRNIWAGSYRAPSFSWASIHGRMYYPLDLSKPILKARIDAISATANAKTDISPFGEVESAFLEVQGRTARCQITQTDESAIVHILDFDVLALTKSVALRWDCDLTIVDVDGCHVAGQLPLGATRGFSNGTSASGPLDECTTAVYRRNRRSEQESVGQHGHRSAGSQVSGVEVGVYGETICDPTTGIHSNCSVVPEEPRTGLTQRLQFEVTCLRVATARVDDLPATEWVMILGPSPSRPQCFERLGMLEMKGCSRDISQVEDAWSKVPKQTLTII